MIREDGFEERMERALRARPLPPSAGDLASRAVVKARQRESAASAWRKRWVIRNRRAWLLRILAGMMMLAVAAASLLRAPLRGEGATDEPTAQQEDAAAEEWLSDEAAFVIICGGLILGTVFLVTAQRCMSGPRQVRSPIAAGPAEPETI